MESIDSRAKAAFVDAFTKAAKALSENPDKVRVKVVGEEDSLPTDQSPQTDERITASAN
ncbi:MAG: hypothetical protein OXU53_05705 [Deltaproteobacteria bacterium]|nr:hypothetical protein [Deltaproteobacteria bacterium]